MAEEKPNIIPPPRPERRAPVEPTTSQWSRHVAPAWGNAPTRQTVIKKRNEAWKQLHGDIQDYRTKNAGISPPIDNLLYERLQDLRLRENDVWREAASTWNSMNAPGESFSSKDINELLEESAFLHLPWRSMVPDKEGRYSVKFPSYAGVQEVTTPFYFNPKSFPMSLGSNGKTKHDPLTPYNQRFFSSGAELQETMRIFDYVAIEPQQERSLSNLAQLYNELPSTIESGNYVTEDMLTHPRMFGRMFREIDGGKIGETTGLVDPVKGRDMELVDITSFDKEGATVDLSNLKLEDQDKLKTIRELWSKRVSPEFGRDLNHLTLKKYLATAVIKERHELLSEEDKQQLKDVGALLSNFQDNPIIRTDSSGTPIAHDWYVSPEALMLQRHFVEGQQSQLDKIELPGEYAEATDEDNYWFNQVEILATEMEQRLQKMSGLSGLSVDGVRAEGHWFVPFVLEASENMSLNLDDSQDMEVLLDLYEDYLSLKMEAQRHGHKIGPYDQVKPLTYKGTATTFLDDRGRSLWTNDTFGAWGKDESTTFQYTSDHNPEIRKIRAFLKGAEKYWMAQHDRDPLADLKVELGVAPEKWTLPKFYTGPHPFAPVHDLVMGKKVPRPSISASFVPESGQVEKDSPAEGREEDLKRAELVKSIPQADTNKDGVVSDKEYVDWKDGPKETTEGEGVQGDPKLKKGRMQHRLGRSKEK